MYQKIRNIYVLGCKELWGLLRDPLLMGLIVFSFTVAVYSGASSSQDAMTDAAIAIVDEDNSQLSMRLADAFLPPYFMPPVYITRAEIDPLMDKGVYTFVLVIPNNFQKDVLAGNTPELQLNVDATCMSQAFIGNGYIEQILQNETKAFVEKVNGKDNRRDPASVVIRNRFNPNLLEFWGGGINEFVNKITMIAIILTGASFIREREHGTLEHLLVMPVTSFEIMVSKIWSMSLVVLVSAVFSLLVIVNGALEIPLAGSFWLFVLGIAINMFVVTSMGIFLACYAKSMPQFGILIILVLLPMQMLSGGSGTSQDNMPEVIRFVMQFAPTTHFVNFSQAILFRGAEFGLVWPHFLKLFVLGAAMFMLTLSRFRKTIAS